MDDFTNVPSGPEAGPQSAVEAYYKGDRKTADRILQQQNEEIVETSDVSSDDAEAPMLPAEIATQAADAISAEVHGGEQLLSEWGGVASPEFDENIQILREFQENATPEIRQLAQSWVTLPDGTQAQLGNTAAAIRYVLDNVKANRSSAPQHNPQPRRSNMSRGTGGNVNSQMESLTEQLHQAMASGNRSDVKRIAAQRDALANRAYGGQPIVGSGGRYA
jgi:hypothetical protein